ncbi:MAG: hypothetical protein A3I52_01400 [Candidatus Blackburnbacteria bacterium RIFCSPLOWO2_02_FULL_40_10]|nr:MAG: hypothetical protein A3I52_01400 [Candidatus Blackburnbacteria bacterium RIFCSPLOWO2_02_FULL_40_10]
MANFGGLEKATLSLCKAIGRSHQVYLLYTSTDSEQYLLSEFKKCGVKLNHLGTTVSGIFEWLRQIRKIINISSKNFDVLCLENMPFGAEALPYIKKNNPNIKIICWIHGHYPMDLNLKMIAKFQGYIDQTIVLNDYFKNKLLKMGVRNVTILPNGVDERLFDPETIKKRDAKKRLNIPLKKFVCAFIGRLYFDKNPLFIIEIARQIKDENIVFIVVGNGFLESELKQQIKKYKLQDKVLQLDYQKDMHLVLAACDTLLITSPLEGMPLVVLEAMAMKVPPITFSFPGVSAIFKNGVHGFTVPLKPEHYIKAITCLKNDSKLYALMGKNCRERVLENFTLDRMVNNFVRVLK